MASVSSVGAARRSHATVFVSNLANDICCPFFNAQGKLHILRQSNGAVMVIDNVGNSSSVHNTSGQPSGASYTLVGPGEEILYVADFAHSAILAFTRDNQQEMVVSVYEDKPLKGPNSICIVDNDVFFTDSGAMGETGLHTPTGSVFIIASSPSGQILRPISLNNLAYPSGIAVSKDRRFIYVAEMMNNRILRFFQQPAGVYHGSVFYQLSGGVGPSSIVLDHATNQLVVAQYDVRDSSTEGSVLILSSSGKLVRTITTNGAELSGLAIHNGTLYITERSTGSILTSDL